jgi:hypothetical protein
MTRSLNVRELCRRCFFAKKFFTVNIKKISRRSTELGREKSVQKSYYFEMSLFKNGLPCLLAHSWLLQSSCFSCKPYGKNMFELFLTLVKSSKVESRILSDVKKFFI